MTDEEFRELFARSEANTRQGFADLRAEMDARFEEMRRYIGVEREENTTIIRAISESVDVLKEIFSGDIADLRAEMTSGFQDTRNMIFWLAKESGVQRKSARRK